MEQRHCGQSKEEHWKGRWGGRVKPSNTYCNSAGFASSAKSSHGSELPAAMVAARPTTTLPSILKFAKNLTWPGSCWDSAKCVTVLDCVVVTGCREREWSQQWQVGRCVRFICLKRSSVLLAHPPPLLISPHPLPFSPLPAPPPSTSYSS
jgi:hypothetical protein